jgi:hypothetical protein
MKKHWIRTLCNGMKKPTGWTGEVGNRIHQCMGIEKKIMQKTHSGIMGFSSSEDESTTNGGGVAGDTENALRDSLFGGGSSSGGGGEDDAINESVESARDTDNDRIDISLPGIPVLPPICQCTQDGTGNKGVEEVTPRVATNNICAGLKRAKNSIRGQKTKNLSSKYNECTLIAGAIVWLVERQYLGGGLAANMSMLMMRQLKALNNSMDKCEQQEKKREQRERKERKRRKQRRRQRRGQRRQHLGALMTMVERPDNTAAAAAIATAAAMRVTVTVTAVSRTRAAIMVTEVGGGMMESMMEEV